MAKFKVYYTIELNEVATHIFESNDFEVKLCSHNDEETYVKELAEFQPDAIMCRTEPTRLRRISYAVFCLKKKKQPV